MTSGSRNALRIALSLSRWSCYVNLVSNGYNQIEGLGYLAYPKEREDDAMSNYPDWVEDRWGDDVPDWAEDRWGDDNDSSDD